MSDTYDEVRLESSNKVLNNKEPGFLRNKLNKPVSTDKRKSLEDVYKEQDFQTAFPKKANLMKFKSQTGLTEKDQEKTFAKMDVTSPEFGETKEFMEAWDTSCDFGIFLYGKPGNGKTHMMKALAIQNATSNYIFRFRTVSDVMDQLKDWENKEFYHEELTEPHALILDDLGTEKASEYEQNQLFRILEHRKNRGRHIFMTSNKTLEELRDTYHPRIFSRLGELMVFCENKAPSYRNVINERHRQVMLQKIEQKRKGADVVRLRGNDGK